MKVVVKLVNQNLVYEIPMEKDRSLVIGRSRRADFTVIDKKVSATHCLLHLKEDKLEVRDLDSKNGIYINGMRVEHSDLFIGDELKLGSTKVSLVEEKLDHTALHFLSVPGASKKSITKNIKLDFTSLKLANPFFYKDPREERIHAPKPVSALKIVQGRVRLSKQEIKKRNQVRSSMASTIDIFLCLLAFTFPLMFMNMILMNNGHALKNYRLLTLSITELIFVGGFIFINFNLLKFSLGEKFSGIEKIYKEQS